MADYDVEILSLQDPPAQAVITSYRPAVSVRNNGIHDALASGYLRIYDTAGRQIFSTELYSAVIPPGETSSTLGTDYWTPPAEGIYYASGYVSCPLDQVEPNNNLAPTKISVSGLPPPPPTPVTPHAAQHEEGAGDELIIDGLHGLAADPQTPRAHAEDHQAGGSDELVLSGLHGNLADPQAIADHHSTHEDGGGDELNVDDLHGVLFNLQKPQVHANEAHDPNYSAKPHGNTDHSTPFLPTSAALYVRDVDAPPIINVDALATATALEASLPSEYLADGDILPLAILASARLASGGTPEIAVEIKHGSGAWLTLATLPALSIPANPDFDLWITLSGILGIYTADDVVLILPTITIDFFRADDPPFWFRVRNSPLSHEIDPAEIQHIRVRYTTPAGADNYTQILQSHLCRGRPNHPE